MTDEELTRLQNIPLTNQSAWTYSAVRVLAHRLGTILRKYSQNTCHPDVYEQWLQKLNKPDFLYLFNMDVSEFEDFLAFTGWSGFETDNFKRHITEYRRW